MRSVRTRPRNNYAELLRVGDEIAVHPMPAKHTQQQACDCVSPPGALQRHCATRFVPTRGLTFLEHNIASVIWVRVIDDPHPIVHENPWFTTPQLVVPVVPTVGDRIGNPVRFLCQPRDPMVTRERIRLEEGQPEPPVGITSAVVPTVGPESFTFPGGGPKLTLVEGAPPLPRRRAVSDPTVETPELRRLHALRTTDASELPHPPGEPLNVTVMNAPMRRVGVAVGRRMAESDAVDFHSARDSDDSKG